MAGRVLVQGQSVSITAAKSLTVDFCFDLGCLFIQDRKTNVPGPAFQLKKSERTLQTDPSLCVNIIRAGDGFYHFSAHLTTVILFA